MPFGSFDANGKRGFTLDQARQRVREFRARYLAGDRDLRDVMERDVRDAASQRVADDLAAEVAQSKAAATLGALLSGYVEQLRRDNKPSAREVERTLHNHVRQPWPKLWATPAESITTDNLLAVVERLANTGKLREMAKLRSYLKSAYAAAIRARQDARGLQALRELKITHNPAGDLVTIDGATQARERAPSLAEVCAY